MSCLGQIGESLDTIQGLIKSPAAKQALKNLKIAKEIDQEEKEIVDALKDIKELTPRSDHDDENVCGIGGMFAYEVKRPAMSPMVADVARPSTSGKFFVKLQYFFVILGVTVAEIPCDIMKIAKIEYLYEVKGTKIFSLNSLHQKTVVLNFHVK